MYAVRGDNILHRSRQEQRLAVSCKLCNARVKREIRRQGLGKGEGTVAKRKQKVRQEIAKKTRTRKGGGDSSKEGREEGEAGDSQEDKD